MAVPTGNVTFLLTDIEGSTRNWETSESDMRAALIRHDELLARHIREHGGAVLTERGEGDSFFAVFPMASGAVAAGLAIQLAIGSEPWPERTPIKVRAALHTGEASATSVAASMECRWRSSSPRRGSRCSPPTTSWRGSRTGFAS